MSAIRITNKKLIKFIQAYPWNIIIIVLSLSLGLVISYFQTGGQGKTALSSQESSAITDPALIADVIRQINPTEGITIPVQFGDIGPQMIAAGVIDLDKFIAVYQQSGQPLSSEQMAILHEGRDEFIQVNKENAYFLLNFFWAFGLSNQNPVLENGPMMQNGPDQVVRFASTGGWTLAEKPVEQIYSSLPMVALTPVQQDRLEQAAKMIYRPCCGNSTYFPDCNHGMAMLGLLELMASQDATVEEMLNMAKYVNAYWFPQQTLEVALFHKVQTGLDFADVNPEQIVGVDYMSGVGFQEVHNWLVSNQIVDGLGAGGAGCGV